MARAVFVTNFNRSFTGVSASAAAVLKAQVKSGGSFHLVGEPLPGCPDPISLKEAFRLSAEPLPEGRFHVWHLRRNQEMWTFLCASRILRLPLRSIFTSSAIRYHSVIPGWLISQMDATVATSWHAAYFLKKVSAVIPHGVDCKEFTPAKDRAATWKELGFGGERGIAVLGRIRPDKGSDLFVQAAIEVIPRFPQARALVIGRTRPKHFCFLESLKRKVREAGLSEQILFPGEMGRRELAALLPALSGLVAVPRHEEYGLTPLEAMASGTPLILSPTGHFPAFIEGQNFGELLPDLEAGGLAQAMEKMLARPPHEVDRLGEAARKHCIAHFSVEEEADALCKFYEKLSHGQSFR